MAKKAKEGELTIAEATRQTWKELGAKALGTDVAKLVETKYGHAVPSSTISTAKKTVFGTKGRVKRKSPAAAGGLPPELKSKTEVILELMETGLDSPTAIVAAAKKMGVAVTPNHVSMVKSSAKKAGGKTSGGKRKKVRRAVSVAPVAVAAARSTGPATDLELENAALKFALRAGGVQAAMQALSRLE